MSVVFAATIGAQGQAPNPCNPAIQRMAEAVDRESRYQPRRSADENTDGLCEGAFNQEVAGEAWPLINVAEVSIRGRPLDDGSPAGDSTILTWPFLEGLPVQVFGRSMVLRDYYRVDGAEASPGAADRRDPERDVFEWPHRYVIDAQRDPRDIALRASVRLTDLDDRVESIDSTDLGTYCFVAVFKDPARRVPPGSEEAGPPEDAEITVVLTSDKLVSVTSVEIEAVDLLSPDGDESGAGESAPDRGGGIPRVNTGFPRRLGPGEAAFIDVALPVAPLDGWSPRSSVWVLKLGFEYQGKPDERYVFVMAPPADFARWCGAD